MIGGSVKVLVYVLAAAFYRCRLDFLAVETVDQVNKNLYFDFIRIFRQYQRSGDASAARDEGRAARGSTYIWSRSLGVGRMSFAARRNAQLIL